MLRTQSGLTTGAHFVLVKYDSHRFERTVLGATGFGTVHRSISMSVSLHNFTVAGFNVVPLGRTFETVSMLNLSSIFGDTWTGSVSTLLEKNYVKVSGYDSIK